MPELKLIPVDHNPFDPGAAFGTGGPPPFMSDDPEFDREAANGGSLTGGYPEFRRSENIEDRRHASAAERQLAISAPVESGINREWLTTDPNIGALGRAAGVHQIQESAARFAQERLAEDRTEYERRKAAGELVWDARFESSSKSGADIRDMKRRGKPKDVGRPQRYSVLIPVDHDPFEVQL